MWMTKTKLAAIAPPLLAMATLVTVRIVLPDVNRDETATDDEAEVRTAEQAYLDGLLHGDVAILESAFHPESRFQGSVGNALVGMTFSDWAESRRGKVMRPMEDYRHSIEDVLISGDAAVVRTDIDWPGTYFVDYLSLLRIDDEWKIVNKIWTQLANPRALGRIDDLPVPSEEASTTRESSAPLARKARSFGDDWYIVREFEIQGDRFLSRQAWLPEGPDELTRVMERSFDGGRTWEPRSRTRFRRVSSADSTLLVCAHER